MSVDLAESIRLQEKAPNPSPYVRVEGFPSPTMEISGEGF